MKGYFSRFARRLTVGRKLALIYFLDLTAVIFVSTILIHEKYIAINFAEKELVGNQYIAVVRDILFSIGPDMTASGAIDNMPAAPQKEMASAVRAAEAAFGAGLKSGELSRHLSQALEHSPSHPGKASAEESAHPAFSVGRELLTRIGNQSNLILDPDLDSYYTMSLIVLRFPELLEILNSTMALTADLFLESDHRPSLARQLNQTRFLILEGRLDAIIAGIKRDYGEAYASSSPELKANLFQSEAQMLQAVESFRNNSRVLAGLASGDGEKSTYLAAYKEALSSLRLAWTVAQAELDRMLYKRIDGFYHRMWTHLSTAALLLGVILSLVFFIARQIARPLQNLAVVTQNVSTSGDYSLRAEWDSEDEIGKLVSGFNGMLAQLDYQRLVQQDLVAQASAAEAQRKLVDAIPIPLIVTAIPHHDVLHANPAAQLWLAGSQRDPWQKGMTPAARARFFQNLNDIGKIDEFEVRWSGGVQPHWALVSARVLDYQGQHAVLTTFTPINKMKQMETHLELWAKVFEASSESILVMDDQWNVVTMNPAFSRVTAFEAHELVGKPPDRLVSERNHADLYASVRKTSRLKGFWQGELWIKRKDEESYPAWLVMNAVRNSKREITHFIAISLDITQRKASEQQIHYLAHHDVLTGLPNRFACQERLQLSMQQARRSGNKVGVMFLDLDRFKNINDSLGHHVGDGLLRSVSERMSDSVREGDTISRLGGDEFIIILSDIEDTDEIARLVDQRLIPSIQKPHYIEGAELFVSCSVGIAVFPDDAEEIDELMRHADAAMYQAKKLGRNNAQFYTPELNERATKRLQFETDMRHAIGRNEFELYYQPRISARTGKCLSVECLIRWKHPIDGMIPPAQFIPIAEESGFIIELGEWTIKTAFQQYAKWKNSALGTIPLSINLSAVQLQSDALIHTLRKCLAETKVDPGHIELELTESLLMENVHETIKLLEQVKAMGFTLSIDDFGVGYSSLNYLYRFPIDKLKIDKSFIQNIHNAPSNFAVIKAIIALGHTMGLEVVAEGVEHANDVPLLRNAGCDEYQGYYFARPMPASAFESWLVRQPGLSVNDGM